MTYFSSCFVMIVFSGANACCLCKSFCLLPATLKKLYLSILMGCKAINKLEFLNCSSSVNILYSFSDSSGVRDCELYSSTIIWIFSISFFSSFANISFLTMSDKGKPPLNTFTFSFVLNFCFIIQSSLLFPAKIT